jgi:hypothetical protein
VLSLTYTAPHKLQWREASEPILSSDGAALVRPLAVGTCDLDALELAAAAAIEPRRITTRVIPWADADAALSERDWTKLVIERARG